MITPAAYANAAEQYNVELATLKAVAAIACIKQTDHFTEVMKGIEERGLTVYLRGRDWAAFAEGYFGASFRENNAEVRLENAYEAFRHLAALRIMN